MTFLVRRLLTAGMVCSLFWFATANVAMAQLRIVTYNTANGSFTGNNTLPRTGMDTVLQAIADEVTGGFAKTIDALILQEQASTSSTTQAFVNLLNGIYGAGTYARSTVVNGPSFSSIHQSLVYNTTTLDLISQQAFGSTGGSNAARQPARFQLRPDGYDASADFYIYDHHFKAGAENSSSGSTTNGVRRNNEAIVTRANADALGQGASIIYAGDFNIRSSNEDMYQTLLSAGNGQAFDPINRPGNWNNSGSFASIHTQSPHDGSDGLVGGGIDDRFDFQLVSGELLDNEGLSYIPNSYHTFGNNGTTFNSAVNAPGNTYPLSNSQLDALAHVSDHLPVVADYQVPAILSAQLASIPPTVPLGATFNVDVLVENVANVISSLGADELDYTISVSGDLSGSATGTDFALGGFNSHPITLDTSVAGLRSGIVTVSSSSQGAANALVNIPVNYLVGQVNQLPFQARDDFDSPIGLNSFTQSPAPDAFSSVEDGFERFQVGVNSTIPVALLDESTAGQPSDTLGVIDAATKTDAWFGITDLVNVDNPSNEGTATWEFDISGASSLEVSIDMAAMGDFEGSATTGDFFNWTYSIDGGPALSLFTSSVDEAGSAIYTLADGDDFLLNDPLVIENLAGEQTQLSNLFQTVTSILSGVGDTLTIELTARTDGGSEAFAFDNIVIDGITVLAADADFDQDGDVDGSDFLAWQRGFGSGTTLAEGDANGDGNVDELDLVAWESQFGQSNLTAQQAATSIPEPSSLLLAIGFLVVIPSRLRSARRT